MDKKQQESIFKKISSFINKKDHTYLMEVKPNNSEAMQYLNEIFKARKMKCNYLIFSGVEIDILDKYQLELLIEKAQRALKTRMREESQSKKTKD